MRKRRAAGHEGEPVALTRTSAGMRRTSHPVESRNLSKIAGEDVRKKRWEIHSVIVRQPTAREERQRGSRSPDCEAVRTCRLRRKTA